MSGCQLVGSQFHRSFRAISSLVTWAAESWNSSDDGAVVVVVVVVMRMDKRHQSQRLVKPLRTHTHDDRGPNRPPPSLLFSSLFFYYIKWLFLMFNEYRWKWFPIVSLGLGRWRLIKEVFFFFFLFISSRLLRVTNNPLTIDLHQGKTEHRLISPIDVLGQLFLPIDYDCDCADNNNRVRSSSFNSNWSFFSVVLFIPYSIDRFNIK